MRYNLQAEIFVTTLRYNFRTIDQRKRQRNVPLQWESECDSFTGPSDPHARLPQDTTVGLSYSLSVSITPETEPGQPG